MDLVLRQRHQRMRGRARCHVGPSEAGSVLLVTNPIRPCLPVPPPSS
ncbi:hypothetical protein DB31_5432 [Hyalangium minutum]|uniref:Uncharacterized protein n=1 Tax=Hyalangium minutum TaxID=394096 RepID=A0A085WRS7_9BACT|nr:hypothetical protein DB31_5432 [Hyalangium minutum]